MRIAYLRQNMNKVRSPSPNMSQVVQMYSEISGETEASPGDIEEYAKRIGIDLSTEPHLKYLAEEGLLKPLPPEWQPCKDITKNSFYYFNKTTKRSQWEHPLDEPYRAKVLQARQNWAMNRMQEVDPLRSRPPRSLPPLKKVGSSRPPTGLGVLGTPPSRLGPLGLGSSGSLGSLGPLGSVYNTNVNTNQNSTNQESEFDLNQNPGPLGDLPPPSSRVVKKPSQLILTGEGANFLKGPKNANLHKSKSSSTSAINTIDNNEPTEVQRPKIKSILSTSQSQSSSQNSKDEERQLFAEIDVPIKEKPGVKFQLDDNTEIKFDISTDENDSEDRRQMLRSTGRSRPDQNEETDDSSTGQSDSDELMPSKGPRTLQRPKSGIPNRKEEGAGEKVQVNLETRKTNLRSNMEAELKKYQQSLEQERNQRESQIKEHTEQTLEGIRLEKESLIRKARQDLDHQKDIELDNLKKELETMVKTEVDKLKLIFDTELSNKKEELRKQHELALSTLSLDFDPIDPNLSRKQSENSLKDHKSQKLSLKEEQLKQIQQMRDYHQTFILKLKSELKSEEQRLNSEHEQKVKEIVKKFEKETSDLHQKLRKEQQTQLAELVMDFDKEKKGIETELRLGLGALRSDLDDLKGKKGNKNPEKEECDQDTVKVLNSKYHQLEKKYSYLKKELKKITNHNGQKSRSRSRSKVDPIQDMNDSLVLVQEETLEETCTDSESTFYPSSSFHAPVLNEDGEYNGTKLEQNSDLERQSSPDYVENPDDNDRLTTALKSLEILKNQIMDIQQGRSMSISKNRQPKAKSTMKTTPSTLSTPRGLKSGDKGPKIRGQTVQTPKQSLRPSRSRSTSNLPGLIEDQDSDQHDLNDPSSHKEIVKEAKEFIRSQKERLNLTKNSQNTQNLRKFDKPISTTWTRPSKNTSLTDDLPNVKNSPKRLANLSKKTKSELYSETESSGVGSMSRENFKSNEKQKISKDIEAICDSLTNLDEQMRLMWSVVQGQGQGNDKSNSNSAAKPTLQKKSRPVTSMDIQYANSINNSLKNNANSFQNNYRTSYEYLLPKRTPSNLLNSLDKELKEFKAAKERILSQFSINGGQGQSQVTGSSTTGESIQEKTKDLREWLEKF